MSAIPPDIAGSAAQAGFTSPEASRIRDADRAAQVQAAARQAKAADAAVDSVETEDADTAIFTDAEGAGSQGRAFSEGEPGEPDVSAPEDQAELPGKEDGPTHLDIQA